MRGELHQVTPKWIVDVTITNNAGEVGGTIAMPPTLIMEPTTGSAKLTLLDGKSGDITIVKIVGKTLYFVGALK